MTRSKEVPGKDVHDLGAFVHGALAAFHGLGVIYNLKRRKWFHALTHLLVMIYDIWCVDGHLREITRLEKKGRKP